jgi:hypothetical protein
MRLTAARSPGTDCGCRDATGAASVRGEVPDRIGRARRRANGIRVVRAVPPGARAAWGHVWPAMPLPYDVAR